MRKLFKKVCLFVTIFSFSILLLGCVKVLHGYSSDKNEYTDVYMVQKGVVIAKDNGLTYLFKDGKKISDGYQVIFPFTQTNEYIVNGRMYDYFYGVNANDDFCIISLNGIEKVIDLDVEEVPYFISNGLFLLNDEGKYRFVKFSGPDSDEVYNSISKVSLNYQFLFCDYIIATKTVNDEEKYYLINNEGEFIISDVEEIEALIISYEQVSQIFFKVKIDGNYRLMDKDGSFLDENVYDGIELMENNLIECKIVDVTINHGISNTYYNALGQSVTYITKDLYGNDNRLYFLNEYFIAYKDGNLSKLIHKTFDGEIKEYLYCTVYNEDYYLFQTSNERALLDKFGNELYIEPSSDYFPSMVFYDEDGENQSYYVILSRSLSKIIVAYSNAEGMTRREYSIDITKYSYSKTSFKGVYLITDVDGGYSFISPHFTDECEDVSELTFYENYYFDICGDIKFITIKDSSNFILIDAQTGIPLILDEDFNNSNLYTNKYPVYLNLENNVISSMKFVLRYRDANQELVAKEYLIFRNPSTQELNYISLEGSINQINTNYFYEFKDNKSKVYLFVYENGEYALKNVFTKSFRINKLLVDETTKKKYFVISSIYNGDQGLCDENGNIILQPNFAEISSIQNGNVIITKNNFQGLIRLKENQDFEIILDLNQERIQFLGEGNTIVTKNGIMTLYSTSGITMEEEILDFERIVYTTSQEDGSYANHLAYKLDFGFYAKIYYCKEPLD